MHTILLVEDDAEIAMVVTHMFCKPGFKVQIDATGANVHGLIASCKPSVVLMDGWLPFKTGLILCKEIKAQHNIPVILFSAATYSPDQVMQCQADGFIEKPFEMHMLEAEVDRLIELYTPSNQ